MPFATPSIHLIAATPDDRARVHGWMTTPGIVERMMGPPMFPEIPVPTFDEFCADWEPHFWTHERPDAGRMSLIAADDALVGAIAQNGTVVTEGGRRAVEIDIWLSSPEVTGRGFGRAAIRLICALLEAAGIDEAFLQPSARNPAAIAAYGAAGFVRSALTPAAAARFYRTLPDYADSVFMVRDLRPNQLELSRR